MTGIAPLYGIKTGLNEAFLIDDACKRKLIAEHDGCKELIKPYVRGSDLGRWSSDWAQPLDDRPALQQRPGLAVG